MEQFAISLGEKFGGFAQWLFNPISQLIFWPLLGCIVICLVPPARLKVIRTLAVIFSALSLLSALMMLTGAPPALAGTPMFSQYQAFRPEANIQFSPSQEAHP